MRIRAGLLAATLVAAGCGGPPESPPVPEFDATDMEPRVVGAIDAARRAVVEDPRSAAAWGQLGVVFDAHELFGPALVAYREARRLDPSDFRWAYFVARLAEITAAPADEIVAAFEEAETLNPGYVPMLVREGDALARLARPADAKAAYERALARDARFARAHRGLGQVLLDLGDAPDAVAHLRTAAELNPEDGAAWASLARAQARAGDRDAARATQARARDLAADHTMPDPILGEVSRAAVTADAAVLRARSSLEQGDPRRALQELRLAEEIRTDDAVVEALFGSALAQLRQDDAALDRYGRALELREDFPEAHAERAVVLVRRGRFREAIADYQRAIALRPGEASFVARLASARAQAGDLPGALEAFQTAVKLGELEAADYNNWGSALAQAGRVEEAAARFGEALRLDPRFANAHFNLGVALEALQRPEEAAEHYRRAVEIEPSHRAGARLAALSASLR